MWTVLNSYKVNPSMAQANTLIDLANLDWKCDGTMDECMNRWDQVLGSMNMAFDVKQDNENNDMLCGIILPKMEKGAVLKEDIAYYYRLMTDGKQPTYEWLRDRMESYLLRTGLKGNREKQGRELQGRTALPAEATPDK